MVTVVEADFVASAELVAVTVTVAGVGAVAGAVKSPLLLMIPHVAPEQPEPVTLQVAVVLELPVTVEVNC